MKKTPITLRPGTISRKKLATVSPISPKEMMAARLEALPIAANSLEDTKANLVQDLHDFQVGSKPLSSELVNCLEAQLALLLKNKLNLNSSGPDFDPDPPPGGAAALPVPTESSYTVVRMSA